MDKTPWFNHAIYDQPNQLQEVKRMKSFELLLEQALKYDDQLNHMWSIQEESEIDYIV